MFSKLLNNYFHINEHNSNIKNEIMAGITNYFTVIYLIILVPEIIIGVFPGAVGQNGELIGDFILNNGITVNQMFVAITAAAFIAAGIGTIIMGLLINIPFVQGPSLAIGTFVTYTVCKNFGYTYNQALAIVFISGICFFIISILKIEKKIHKAIPNNLKYAVTAGIGLFIAFSGLQKAHIINYSVSSVTNLFNISDLTNNYTKDALLALFGIIFITILLKKHIHGAIFIGKIVCILLAIPLGIIKTMDIEKFKYSIDFSKVFFQMDFNGLIDTSSNQQIFNSIITISLIVFSICIMDIFETMSMLIAADNYIKESNDGMVKKRIPQILEIDALTTSVGAAMGSTNISTYIESSTGIIEGGRTGLTAVITGILFLISVFITPVVSIIPSPATATTLFMAGVIMMNVIKKIDFEDISEAVPAFLTMFIMPLTNSLITGISFGIISYLIINIFIGNAKKINYLLYILAILFFITLLYFYN